MTEFDLLVTKLAMAGTLGYRGQVVVVLTPSLFHVA
jgi:hypothetical protein